MRRAIAKKINVLFIGFVILVFIAALSFTGCKPSADAVTEEETAAETDEETAIKTTEETQPESDIEEFDPDNFNKEQEKITGNINILTGIEISDSVLQQRPMAIMVENTPDARPQSGLANADVVYEVVDEFGITRFVVVFSSYDSNLVGPVRSARPYYAEIAASFDPVYVFWGTHPNFYKVVEQLGLDYLSPAGDESGQSSITGNFVDPWETGENKDAIRDGTRQRPHNAYVRIPRMREIADSLGYASDGGQTSFYFKEDASEEDRGDITGITINFSSNTYKVDFEYESSSNKYLRFCGGAASMDRETEEQLAVNNVIVLFTDIRDSGNKEGHMLIRTTQSGEAYYFMDGKVIEGTWSRLSALDPFEFMDKEGRTILVNRGQTWVTMISGIEQLQY